MTHRPVEAALAKEWPGSGSRDGFEKDFDCETLRREYGFKWKSPSATRLFSRTTNDFTKLVAKNRPLFSLQGLDSTKLRVFKINFNNFTLRTFKISKFTTKRMT